MKKITLLLLIFLFNIILANPILSEEDNNTKQEDNNTKAKDVISDIPIPESPAFTILGLNTQNVMSPTTPRDLVTSLLNGVDNNGNFQSGIAIDTTILNLFGDKVTIDDYRATYLSRFGYRTQLSLATSKGTNDEDKSMKIAGGIRLTLFDFGDPRSADSDLANCYLGVFNKYPKPTPKENETAAEHLRRLDSYKQKFNKRVLEEKEVEHCKKVSSKKDWNKSRWIVAFAPSWISPTGDTGDLNWNGAGYWTSLAIGQDILGSDSLQLIIHARYRSNEEAPDPNNTGSFINQDSTQVGGQLQWGVTPQFILSGEGSLAHENPDAGPTDNYYLFSLGTHFKVSNDLWLKLGYSWSSDRSNQPDQGSVLANLQWAFGQGP